MYVCSIEWTASVLDMLRGIIIQSGNDASKAMAEHIAGNEGTFAYMMNQEAKRIGMNNTHFMNATGLPSDGHYSTAKDMERLHNISFMTVPSTTQSIQKKSLLSMVSNKVTAILYCIQIQVLMV